jgi:hypothetical protein
MISVQVIILGPPYTFNGCDVTVAQYIAYILQFQLVDDSIKSLKKSFVSTNTMREFGVRLQMSALGK